MRVEIWNGAAWVDAAMEAKQQRCGAIRLSVAPPFKSWRRTDWNGWWSGRDTELHAVLPGV